VNKVLIAEDVYYPGASETKEYYMSVLLDRASSRNVIVYSTEGGMDIEEVAEHHTGQDPEGRAWTPAWACVPSNATRSPPTWACPGGEEGDGQVRGRPVQGLRSQRQPPCSRSTPC
jgi:hypothetical protein